MVTKDEFDIFCENNGIVYSTIVINTSHEFVLSYPNNEQERYQVPAISQVEELYRFREMLYKDARLKMRNIKLWKLTH